MASIRFSIPRFPYASFPKYSFRPLSRKDISFDCPRIQYSGVGVRHYDRGSIELALSTMGNHGLGGRDPGSTAGLHPMGLDYSAFRLFNGRTRRLCSKDFQESRHKYSTSRFAMIRLRGRLSSNPADVSPSSNTGVSPPVASEKRNTTSQA